MRVSIAGLFLNNRPGDEDTRREQSPEEGQVDGSDVSSKDGRGSHQVPQDQEGVGAVGTKPGRPANPRRATTSERTHCSASGDRP